MAWSLLGAQFALLLHVIDDIDVDHHTGEVCEVCLHAAALDTGIAPSDLAVASPPRTDAALPDYHALLTAACARHFDARGPPRLRSA